MFPLFFLLGFKTMEEFMVSVGMTQNTLLQPVKYGNPNTNNMTLYTEINKDIFDELANFLMTFEGYEPVAIPVRGESFATGGYGSTNHWDTNGRFVRQVKTGDKFTREYSYQQIINYYRQNDFINKFNMRLKSSNIALSKGVLVGLLQVCYMGGLGLASQNWFNSFLVFADKNQNLQLVAERFKSVYIAELKSYKKTTKSCPNSPTGFMYYCFGLGWTRRTIACCNAMQGIYKSKDWYDTNIKNRL